MVFFLIKKKLAFYKSGTGSKLVQLVLAMLEHTNFAQDKPRLEMRKETGQFSELSSTADIHSKSQSGLKTQEEGA